MERKEQVVVTNICMVKDGSRILVQDKVGCGADGIFLPGGHVEAGEPIVDSVIREVWEETGLTIESPKLVGIKDWFDTDGSRYMVFMFTAEKFSGELKSSEEGKVFWMEASEVLKSNWVWHMDKMMKIMWDGEYAELFLDDKDDWKPVLK